MARKKETKKAGEERKIKGAATTMKKRAGFILSIDDQDVPVECIHGNLDIVYNFLPKNAIDVSFVEDVRSDNMVAARDYKKYKVTIIDINSGKLMTGDIPENILYRRSVYEMTLDDLIQFIQISLNTRLEIVDIEPIENYGINPV